MPTSSKKAADCEYPAWVDRAFTGTINEWKVNWNQMRKQCSRYSDTVSGEGQRVEKDAEYTELSVGIQKVGKDAEYTQLRNSGPTKRIGMVIVIVGLILIITAVLSVLFLVVFTADRKLPLEPVIVRVRMQVTVTNLEFTDHLLDNTSQEYRSLADSFTTEVDDIYRNEKAVNESYKGTLVDNIEQGSVRVGFSIILVGYQKDLPSKEDLSNVLERRKSDDNDTQGNMGRYQIDIRYIKVIDFDIISENPLTTTVLSDTSTTSTTVDTPERNIPTSTTKITTSSPIQFSTIVDDTMKPTTVSKRRTLKPTSVTSGTRTTEALKSSSTDAKLGSRPKQSFTITMKPTYVSTTSTLKPTSVTSRTRTTSVSTSTEAEPRITFSASTYKVFLGEPVQLACSVNSVPSLKRVEIYRIFGNESEMAIVYADGMKTSNITGAIVGDPDEFHVSGTTRLNLKFDSASCQDEGDYFCRAVGVTTNTTTAYVVVMVKPTGNPSLEISREIIANKATRSDIPHKCSGLVGYPGGELVIQINKNGKFVELNVERIKVEEIPEDCPTRHVLKFAYTFPVEYNNTRMRCIVRNNVALSADDIIPTSQEQTILVLPEWYCRCFNGSNAFHPYNCHLYVSCAEEKINVGTCGALCWVTNGTSCDRCEELLHLCGGINHPALTCPSSTAVSTVTTTNPTSPTVCEPTRPSLHIRSTIYENQYTTISCSGRLGNPQGNMYLQVKFKNSSHFVNVTVAEMTILEDNCYDDANLVYNFFPSSDWNEATVRCVVTREDAALESIQAIIIMLNPVIAFLKATYEVLFQTKVQLRCQVQIIPSLKSVEIYRVVGTSEELAVLYVNGTRTSTISGATIGESDAIEPNGTTAVTLNFNGASCADKGQYLCRVNGDMMYTTATFLNIRVEPDKAPSFELSREIVENAVTRGDIPHTCTGSVGFPGGELVIQSNKTGTFVDIAVNTYDLKKSIDDCSNRHILQFGYSFSATWNNTKLRCIIRNKEMLSDTDILASEERTVQIIPENYCQQGEPYYTYHPFKCNYYIYCSGAERMFVYICGTGLCWGLTSTSACGYCEDVSHYVPC